MWFLWVWPSSWYSVCIKMVIFYKTYLVWPFHSMNRHNNSQNTTLWMVSHVSKIISKAHILHAHFWYLECEFRQTFRHTYQKFPNNPILSFKLFLGPTRKYWKMVLGAGGMTPVVIFYKNCVEWSFHSENRPKNGQ